MYEEILRNEILIAAFSAWIIAQSLKIIIVLIVDKKFDLKRFIESGGMPSSHSALVSALATGLGTVKGWDSEITAVALVFALIVMYDAAGVRRAAGKQAEIINKIIDEYFHQKRTFREERLKELIGHTPIEVIIGSLLGIVTAIIII